MFVQNGSNIFINVTLSYNSFCFPFFHLMVTTLMMDFLIKLIRLEIDRYCSTKFELKYRSLVNVEVKVGICLLLFKLDLSCWDEYSVATFRSVIVNIFNMSQSFQCSLITLHKVWIYHEPLFVSRNE